MAVFFPGNSLHSDLPDAFITAPSSADGALTPPRVSQPGRGDPSVKSLLSLISSDKRGSARKNRAITDETVPGLQWLVVSTDV